MKFLHSHVSFRVRGCPAKERGLPQAPPTSLGVLTLCPFASTGDECGLCQRDPGDEHDPHGRARLHAVHPHRGEKQGRCAGPTPLSTGRGRACCAWVKDILACLTKVFTFFFFFLNRYVHMVLKNPKPKYSFPFDLFLLCDLNFFVISEFL